MCKLQLLLLCVGFTTSHVNGSPGTKREIVDYGPAVHSGFGASGLAHSFNHFQHHPQVEALQPVLIPKTYTVPKQYTPSPAEIAAAVTAAKEASANVFHAQQRVQAAKEDVLAQQRIASHKEAQAALALQQSEAAAAVQRQQASAAASAVVLAQQRLAQAKADVADQQRFAAEKEAAAAQAIRKAAEAAAVQMKKTEHAAAKVAALQSSEAAAALKHVTAAKEATLAATSAAVAAASGHGAVQDINPWKFIHFSPWR